MTDNAEKRIQRGFFDGLAMDVSDRPPASATGISKWGAFKQVFMGKIGTMVLLNLLTLIFALPALAVIIWFFMITSNFNSIIPYSANIGIGYPVVVDAELRAQSIRFIYNAVEYAMLVPCIMLLFIGLGGNLYVMRKLILGESKKPAREFFAGVKKTWWRALLIGLLVGCAIYLFVTTIGILSDNFNVHIAYKVLSIILSTVILVFVVIFSIFYMSQSASFSMKTSVCARNSALLAIGSHVIGIFFAAIAIAPILLLFWQAVFMFGVLLFVFLGFSYFSIVVMLFCSDQFDKYLYDKAVTVTVYNKNDKPEKADNEQPEKVKVEEKPEKTEPTAKADKPVKQAVKYKNPKKGKK